MQSSGSCASTSDGESEVGRAWKGFYEEIGPEAGRRVPLGFTAEYQRVLFRELVKEVERKTVSGRRVRLWSAGCGIDPVSLQLVSRFGESVEIVLQDLSAVCMDINAQMFSRAGLLAEFSTGDIFESSYREEFDVVFNTGLLEHFTLSEKERLLWIFSDSLRPGGVYVTLTPSAGGKVYNFCRRRMAARGTWKVGPEEPVSTLRGLDCGDMSLVEEYPVAPLDQITIFMPQAFPLMALPSEALRRLGVGVSRFLDPMLTRAIGGYCLLNRFKKRA